VGRTAPIGPLLRSDQRRPAPSARHLLGTDSIEDDELGRLMVGGQITLLLALAVAVLPTTIGLIWGSAAGVVVGGLDSLMMCIVDAALAIPGLFLMIFWTPS